MRATLQHAGLAALVSVLAACSDGGRTAGGGWDETENTMTARIQGPDGKPTEGAKVYLVDVGNWTDSVSRGASPVVDSAITDSLGLVKLSTSVDGTVAVEAFHHGNASRTVREVVASVTDTVPLVLQPAVSVEGAFDSTQRPSDVRIAGSSLVAPVHDNGSFSIPWVPTGTVAVMAVVPDTDGSGASLVLATTASVEPGAGTIQLGGLRSQVGHVLLDDFEDDIWRNRFGPTMSDSSGWWYYPPDPTYTDSLFFSGGTLAGKDCGEMGRCLSVIIVPSSDRGYPVLGMDFDLGSGACKNLKKPCSRSDSLRVNHDLTGLTSITFLVKGDSSLGPGYLQLVRASEPGETIPKPVFQASFEPRGDWRRVTFYPTDFSVSGVGTFDRAEILRHISGILWLIPGAGQVMIDSVEFHGVTEEQLFRR